MEELKRLEQIQSTLLLLESHGTHDAALRSDSDCFLANFLLFLVQPCGNLSVDDKCRLISEYLPKISAEFLERASLQLGCRQTYMDNLLAGDPVNNAKNDKPQSDLAVIGLESMQRANSTLEDFCRSYFMFHGLDVNRPENIFRHLPVLCFTESYMYQLDGLNEKMLQVPSIGTTVTHELCDVDISTGRTAKLMKAFESDPFQPLVLLLEHQGLLTQRIVEELRLGEEYWALERKLCSALTRKMEISIEDVMRAIHLKSFDYRVLNLLSYQLRGEKVDELHMEFLSVSELLVEIADDLFDYEEDVLDNNFNILRMFVKIYGASAASAMLAKCIAEAEEKYEHLSKALDPQLSLSCRRRCEEATREGGKISGHPLGSWTIPPLIVDEELYRSMSRNSV